MLSGEFSEEEEDWSNLQQPSQPAALSLSIQQYQNAIGSVAVRCTPASVDLQVLRHHRIAITQGAQLSSALGVFERECFISIKKKLHFGTHVVYDVALAHFLLEIHLLNLHRNSDEKDLSTSESELGSGGFGSVRKVAAGGGEFAVKRISFVSKAERAKGFDIETERAEHEQIRRAIREYCLFKICSMFGIGPRVLFSSFDLVCFNNCMEFAMELCQCPASSPSFLSQRDLNVESLQQHLLENLKTLHSLRIVHRDIKPENILFSQSLGRFVFADFGISHAVKEGPGQKSRTNFAGTVEYCSEEMKEVLSTGVGLVDLYLNDFVGLTKTLAKFSEQACLSSSISRNPMSYNQSSGFVRSQEELGSASNSIEEWFQRECSQSCSALSPLKEGSENIYITSTHSLEAPSHFSAQINHFEALILYQLTRHPDIETRPLPASDILRAIEAHAEQINDDYILEETRKYVMAAFYPSDNSSQLALNIVELKNTARNYGPKSEETLRKLEELIEEKEVREDGEVCGYFTALRQQIIEDKDTYGKHRFFRELLLHLHIKNYTFVIGCGLRVLREAKIASDHAGKRKQDHSANLSTLCKIFIICNRLDVLSTVERHLINQLFLQVWDHIEHEQLHLSIKEEVQAHSYSRYGFHQDPTANRITAKLMKHAVLHLIKHEETADQEVILVLQYFLKKYDYTDPAQYKVFYQYLQRQTDKLKHIRDSNERCALSVELAKVYRKMCLLENHSQIDKESLLQRVQKLVEELGEDTERKYYYILCAVQLIWMKFQQNDYSTALALQLLDQLQAFQCRPVEKNQLLVQLSQIMGCISMKTGRFEESFHYLRQTETYIKSFYGVSNLSNSYYECLNNIAYLYHQTSRHQEALAAYESLLDLVERTKKALTYQKSLLYRAIITVRIELGVSREEYPLMNGLIKSMVQETIFALISLTASDNELSAYVIDASIFSFVWVARQTDVKVFVMKALLRHIEDHLRYFQAAYDRINYELNKIYVKELGQPSRGLAFIWNYLKVKLLDFKGVTRQDFRLMNDFTANLTKNNSSRRALIVLKKYIFHLPSDYYEERKAAFRLLHKIHFSIAHPLEAVTAHLVARECENLYSRSFGRIYRRENTQADRRNNLLLQKWLARL